MRPLGRAGRSLPQRRPAKSIAHAIVAFPAGCDPRQITVQLFVKNPRQRAGRTDTAAERHRTRSYGRCTGRETNEAKLSAATRHSAGRFAFRRTAAAAVPGRGVSASGCGARVRKGLPSRKTAAPRIVSEACYFASCVSCDGVTFTYSSDDGAFT